MPTPNNIAVPNEVDAYTVQLQANIPYIASVTGAERGSSTGNTLPNPFAGVSDSAGNIIAVQDDNPAGGVDPRMSFQVPASGDYLLLVGDITGGTGTYTVGVYDQQNTLQPGAFLTDVVVDPTMASGPPPGSFGPPPSGFSPIPPGQPGGFTGSQDPSVGVTGVPQNDTDLGGFLLV
jgi:hypothetical protein